jgi:hypothetical protein
VTGNLEVTGLHSGSHRQLLHLATPSEAVPAALDAILVPSARTAPYLKEAVRLATELGCVLVVLCSRLCYPRKVADLVRSMQQPGTGGLEFVTVEMTGFHPPNLPEFASTARLANTGFDRRTDTSLKRNVGLALARMAGWQRVLFLDDDVTVPEPDHLRGLAGLLGRFDAVGLAVGGQKDNSVVCHAHRAVGGHQETFIGGGALGVSRRRFGSYFPSIYNEDWFFLLDEDGLAPAAEYGAAIHKPYDPYADPERARAQEFGDDIAEGLFWLLDQGGKIGDATESYWKDFLAKRRAFITAIVARVLAERADDGERARMVACLKAARGRAEITTPEFCVSLLDAWNKDRKVWRRAVERLPRKDLVGSLQYLKLRERSAGTLGGRPFGARYGPRVLPAVGVTSRSASVRGRRALTRR